MRPKMNKYSRMPYAEDFSLWVLFLHLVSHDAGSFQSVVQQANDK